MMADVTNATLLEDIANTEKEVEAYRQLAEGYRTLASLPENDNQEYVNLARHYNSLCDECRTFLGKLNKIKTERGL